MQQQQNILYSSVICYHTEFPCKDVTFMNNSSTLLLWNEMFVQSVLGPRILCPQLFARNSFAWPMVCPALFWFTIFYVHIEFRQYPTLKVSRSSHCQWFWTLLCCLSESDMCYCYDFWKSCYIINICFVILTRVIWEILVIISMVTRYTAAAANSCSFFPY